MRKSEGIVRLLVAGDEGGWGEPGNRGRRRMQAGQPEERSFVTPLTDAPVTADWTRACEALRRFEAEAAAIGAAQGAAAESLVTLTFQPSPRNVTVRLVALVWMTQPRPV